MPKIEVQQEPFFTYLGKTLSTEELEAVLPVAKAELEERDDTAGVLKIELNDTNRPDLWSTAGLARQLGVFLNGNIPSYPFFSDKKNKQDYQDRTIIVDPNLQPIRPFITGFVIKGQPVSDPVLIDIIQSQEKLCWNFGRKRKAIAMGVYRNDLIQYPIHYTAADPDATSFVPLEEERSMSLQEILKDHPKGREFGHIVKDYDKYPFLTDDRGEVLSFPPVINSAHVGAVQVGDTDLFIELTGTDINSLTLATSIIACDLADSGFTVLPVKVVYPYDTPFGREVVTPYYFQDPVSVDITMVNKLLGSEFSVEEAAEVLTNMGYNGTIEGDTITISPPEYRNDFLHPVDIVEDIMIGKGMDHFEPILPTEFTVGRYTKITEFGRRVKDIMIGLGFQEMDFTYLGSKKEYLDFMVPDGVDNPASKRIIKIANPMTENYEYVRHSTIPSLLSSESVSANAVYPHRIFEVGKVAWLDESENYGSRTADFLGFLTADKDAGFNGVSSHVSALFFYLSREYSLQEAEDPRFISGRCARIVYKGAVVGIFGEIHPGVLEQWGIQVPCTGCEIDLNLLIEK